MSFLDGLDEVLGIEKKPVAPEPKSELGSNPFGTSNVVEAGEETAETQEPAAQGDPEFEPEKVADEWDLPAPTPDEYTRQMDAILAGEGIDVEKELRRRYDPAQGNMNNHEWESVREAIFEDEPFEFKCKRCGKYVHPRRGRVETEDDRDDEDDATLDPQGNPVGTTYDAQGNPTGTVYDANGEPIPPDPAVVEAARLVAEEEAAKAKLRSSSAKQMNDLDRLLGLEPEKIEVKRKGPKIIEGESIEQALEREGVNPNCAYVVVQDVTDE